MRDCFLEDSGLMLVIELVSKWEICGVLWSIVFCLIWFGDLTRIILHGFLMEDLLRLVGLV